MSSESDINAVFFDGTSSARREVCARVSTMLEIRDAGGDMVDRWPLAEIRRRDSPPGMLRLRCEGRPELARLETRDEALIARLRAACPALEHGYRGAHRGYGKIVAWSLAAVASLTLVAYFGIPMLSERIAPLVPPGLERRLGDSVDRQVRDLFRAEGPQVFSCETEAKYAHGRAALGRLVDAVGARAGVERDFEVSVIRHKQPNAVALPGGRIYVFSQLLGQMETPDELAAVLAHEMGHVVHRHGLKRLIEAAGLSFVFGMVLGDFGGGTIAVFAANAVLNASYTRDAERIADDFAVEAMNTAGRDGAALARALARIAPDKDDRSVFDYMRSHPLTGDRAERINSSARPAQGPALVSDGDWRAIRAICAD